MSHQCFQRFDFILLGEINDRGTESEEKDKKVHMCRLILLYTIRKINPSSRIAG